jgi:hypothetical protein
MLLNGRRIAFFALLLLSNFAHAIGDSAGGGCVRNPPLEIAAIAGTPKELEIEIDRQIASATDFGKKILKLLSHPNHEKYSIWVRPETISAPITEKRTIFINWWSGCQGIRVLELAVAGGNQSTTQYLLDTGADPNITIWKNETIFMRCANLTSDHSQLSSDGVTSPTHTMIEEERKIAAYSLILAKGGDLNRLNDYGLSALHLCKDPDAIAFFVENGANPNRPDERNVAIRREKGFMSEPVLDFRIRRILEDYDSERDANFSTLRKLLPVIENKTLKRETMWRICFECSSNAGKAETCQRLAKIIDVPDQDIFDIEDHSGLKDPDDMKERNDIFEKCRSQNK